MLGWGAGGVAQGLDTASLAHSPKRSHSNLQGYLAFTFRRTQSNKRRTPMSQVCMSTQLSPYDRRRLAASESICINVHVCTLKTCPYSNFHFHEEREQNGLPPHHRHR